MRRAIRGGEYELVFGYTSGLDLIGHVSHSRPELQQRAYDEVNEFVGAIRSDLDEGDELVVVSDHGLQDGLHTEEAMIAATDSTIIEAVSSVIEVCAAVEAQLGQQNHTPTARRETGAFSNESEVREQLKDLGYM